MDENKISVFCKNTNKEFLIDKGTNLNTLKKIVFPDTHCDIIGVLVNNDLKELSYVVFKPKNIEYITVSSLDGYSVYTRSTIFVLYKAISNLFPGTRMIVRHLISNGIFCVLTECNFRINREVVERIKTEMQRIVDADIPIKNEDYPTEEAIAIYSRQGLKDKKDLLMSRGKIYTSVYTIENTSDYFYGILAPSTGCLKVFGLEHYENGLLLRLPDRNNPGNLLPVIRQNKLFNVFNEYKRGQDILRVSNIGDLNNMIQHNESGNIIKINEALHEKRISQIADEIKSTGKRIKIVLIAGPSSSGKTTFGKRLNIQLMVNGIRPVNISLDNYFINRKDTPKDKNGEYDYETINALDIDTFNRNILDLLEGKTVELPRFSFETGSRFYTGQKTRLPENNIIIVEGIHGLNPKLTHMLPAESMYKIFVSALTTISIDDHNIIYPKDNRLIRRMVRDYKYRNYSAIETLKRWESVLEGEEDHIVPYQEEADVIFNSALVYELGALKQQAESILREVTPIYPEYSKAQRLLKFFSYINPVHTWEIPPTSILREFLGGSSFRY